MDEHRFCIHCGADCWPDDDLLHDATCPQRTGVWPVLHRDVTPYGLRCMDCSVLLVVGDHYMLRDLGGDCAELVCVGCAAQVVTA